jgi:hypothetical protein
VARTAVPTTVASARNASAIWRCRGCSGTCGYR